MLRATLREGNSPHWCASTCGPVDQRAKQLHLRLQLSQPEANRLVVEDWLLEDLPLSRVLDGLLNDVLHHGQTCRRSDEGEVTSPQLRSAKLGWKKKPPHCWPLPTASPPGTEASGR